MSSMPNVKSVQIDFTKLKLSVILPSSGSYSDEEGANDGSDSEPEDEDDEFAFTKEYKFSVADPNYNPPPRVPYPVGDLDDNLSPQERLFHRTDAQREWLLANRAPQPLVEILVRTIDRKKIPRGEFHSYMDNVCEDFLQFSMAVFTSRGYIKQSLVRHDSQHANRGPGVWGSEINHGTLAYIERLKINPKYQRQGVGRWAIESLMQSDVLAHCPYFFAWATALDASERAEFDAKKEGVIAFWRAMGFRRVGGTWFFGYARDPQHPMRSLKAEDDAETTQTKGASVMDVYF